MVHSVFSHLLEESLCCECVLVSRVNKAVPAHMLFMVHFQNRMLVQYSELPFRSTLACHKEKTCDGDSYGVLLHRPPDL